MKVVIITIKMQDSFDNIFCLVECELIFLLQLPFYNCNFISDRVISGSVFEISVLFIPFNTYNFEIQLQIEVMNVPILTQFI